MVLQMMFKPKYKDTEYTILFYNIPVIFFHRKSTTMTETTASSGDNKNNGSTQDYASSPSAVATENTMLSPAAKQAYFKDNTIQIPETEKVVQLNSSKYYRSAGDKNYFHI